MMAVLPPIQVIEEIDRMKGSDAMRVIVYIPDELFCDLRSIVGGKFKHRIELGKYVMVSENFKEYDEKAATASMGEEAKAAVDDAAIVVRERFRQALADNGHSEATVYGHWALAAFDTAHNNKYKIKIINVVDSDKVLIQRNGVEVHRDITK